MGATGATNSLGEGKQVLFLGVAAELVAQAFEQGLDLGRVVGTDEVARPGQFNDSNNMLRLFFLAL